MPFSRRFVLVMVLAVGLGVGFQVTAISTADDGGAIDADDLKGLSWRSIGPAHFSGRVSDVAGVPGNPDIFYVAFASAGLFKTTNGGITFESIFDDQGTISIGAIALVPDDPKIIYVGTGEGNVRNSVSIGDGIYKSSDGGESWTHLGLRDSERFARIVIHPGNPDVVYAATLGHEWGANRERGLFRSRDGGVSWKNVLFVNETTGASDVALDPADPDIVYCGMYDYLRRPWHFRSGGPGSGLYRSQDGGETWTRLTDPELGNGLPGADVLGRIGVSVCASHPDVVYAMIESREPGELWRSPDRGRSWTMVSADQRINNRPFYYTDVRADPVDADRVYALAGGIFVSEDGGKSWRSFGNYGSLFGDHHALWIDPSNPRRALNGNDGGLYLTNDRGSAWEFLNTMPSAQAYHVGVDMAEPYNVMGGFQDHEIWIGPSEKWNQVGVRGGDWRRLRDMADGMHAMADPRDPDIIYYNGHFGDITRLDLRNAEERFIQPYPIGPTGTGVHMDLYRFGWNSPVHISPHDPDVVYYGGNVLFKTRDGGSTWDIISPDLTTDDKSKQQLSGGPISPDNTRAEAYCTIQSISESPIEAGVIWVGTDDGHVQLTRDGGRTWTNLSPEISGLPESAWIPTVYASPHRPGGAFVAVDQHRLDDFSAYAFATDDFGKTWRSIGHGLRGWVHMVMEDPRTPGLLYAGTELGIYASFDGGERWIDFRLGIPPLSVQDMLVHPRANDLVIATHARGFYILDDVTPLQELARGTIERAVVFEPVPAVRYTPASDTSTIGDKVFAAPNKPYGVILSYFLPESTPSEKVAIEILKGDGIVLRTLSGPGRRGINRAIWDLRENVLAGWTGPKLAEGFLPRTRGMRAMPGEYSVRLQALGEVAETGCRIRLDPRIQVDPDDLVAYESAVRRLTRMSVLMEEALFRIRIAEKSIGGPEAGDARRRELARVRDRIQAPRMKPENLNLRGRVRWLLSQVSKFSGRPTQPQTKWIGILEEQLGKVRKELDGVLIDLKPVSFPGE